MLKSFNENRFLKNEYGVAMPYKLAVNTTLKVEKVEESADFDINSINDRLGQGDKDALKELEAQRISYSLIENANGYTVKYSYEGSNYTIVYFAPETPATGVDEAGNTGAAGNVGETEDTEAPSDVEESDGTEAPSGTEEPEETEETDFVFDYAAAGVDEDVKAENLYNEDKVEDNDSLNSFTYKEVTSSYNGPDSGTWDALFAELEKMKPQLKEYMKQQLEKYGFVYDEETADKLLNQFITEAVETLIADLQIKEKEEKYGNDIKHFVSLIDEPHEPLETIEDLVNYIKDKLDLTKEDTGAQYNSVSLVDKKETPYENKWYLDMFEKNEDNQNSNELTELSANSSEYSIYIDEDGYLLETADYFLTEEEKELKQILQMLKGQGSIPVVKTKNEAIEYIDKYTSHLQKVLQHRYLLMPEEQFNQIFNNLVSSFKNNQIPDPDEIGMIYIHEVLQAFDDYVREEMQKKYNEFLENSWN